MILLGTWSFQIFWLTVLCVSGLTHGEHGPVHTVVLRQAGSQKELAKKAQSLRRHVGSLIEQQPTTMIAMTNLRDSQYVGPIGVGTDGSGRPQSTVNVVFDTGSTNMWVSSTLCKSLTCKGRSQFNPEASKTYAATDIQIDIPFGTGELEGPLGEDTIFVGPYKIVNQTFGLIEEEVGMIFSQIPFEGILGLGFPSMAADKKRLPFFDTVIQEGVLNGHNEFSFYFTKLPMQASAVFFGGTDPRFYEDKIKLFPVIQEHYWTIELVDFRIGNESLATIPTNAYRNAGQRVTKLIADTGTTYFTAPPGIADIILNKLPSTDCSRIKDYPNLTYTLRDENGKHHDLVIEPTVYMVSSSFDYCEPAFMEIPVPELYGPAFLLGEVFMREYHTTFDRGNGQRAFIGFAKAKHDKMAINSLLEGRTASGTIAL